MNLVASSIREKYDKHWECTEKINKILIIDSILDPHWKMNFTKHIFSLIFSNDNAKIEEIVAVMKGLLNSLFDAYSGWNSLSPLHSESFPNYSTRSGGVSSSFSPHLIDYTDWQQEFIMEHSDDTLRVSRPFLGYAKKISIQNEGKHVSTDVERYSLDPLKILVMINSMFCYVGRWTSQSIQYWRK